MSKTNGPSCAAGENWDGSQESVQESEVDIIMQINESNPFLSTPGQERSPSVNHNSMCPLYRTILGPLLDRVGHHYPNHRGCWTDDGTV